MSDADPSPQSPAAIPATPHASPKSLREILGESASWDALRDLLTYELPNPFGGGQRGDLADIALKEGWVSEAQLAELGKNREALDVALGKLLVERGLLTPDQLSKAVTQRQRTGQPLWRTVMHLRLVVPEQVVQVLGHALQLPRGERPDSKFCQYLVTHAVVTSEQLDAAWREARELHVEFIPHLRSLGLVNDEQGAQALAYELGHDYDSLETVVEVPPKLVHLLPASVLRRHHALPYKMDGERLCVAFAEERHLRELQKLGLLIAAEVKPVIVPAARLQVLIERHVEPEDAELVVGSDEEHNRLEEAGKMMPAVELLSVVVRGLMKCAGTDIHLEPQRDGFRVRYRVDGLLHEVVSLTRESGLRLATRIQTLGNMYAGTSLLPLDGHLLLTVDGKEIQFRVATVAADWGPKLALRRVDSDMAFCSLERLGMNVAQRRVLNAMLSSSYGLVMATGPVGSGKTTTIYACLNLMDCFAHNVMTIEDPVEYQVAGITQVPVNAKIGRTFSVGLRALLRQDPDVIMVGEIRDEETADSAVRAAMTGQLVLTSLHANSAAGAVSSLLQLGVQPFLMSTALRGVIFQQLVRVICPACRESYTASPAQRVQCRVSDDEPLLLYRGRGCEQCFHTGYHGRQGVFELLPVTEELRESISEGTSPRRLAEVAARSGLLPLRDHALALVRAGVTTIEEMARIL